MWHSKWRSTRVCHCLLFLECYKQGPLKNILHHFKVIYHIYGRVRTALEMI